MNVVRLPTTPLARGSVWLYLTATVLPLLVCVCLSWSFLRTTHRPTITTIKAVLAPLPRTQRARAQRQLAQLAQRQEAIDRSYLWGMIALLGFALCVGWAFYQWQKRGFIDQLLRLRQLLQSSLPPEAPTHDEIPPNALLQTLYYDLHSLQKELQELQQDEQFKEQVERWQDVARRLAHEIKNPLTPILLTTQQVHRKYPGNEAKYKRLLDTSLEIVEHEVETLRRLVEEFSAFAKLPQANPRPMEVGQLLHDFLEAYDWFQDQAEIHYKVPTQELWANIDRMLFQQVLHNLTRNAIEAGSPTLEIRVGRMPSGQIICQLEDRGPGIPTHLQSKVFTPYFTTKEFGSGLGLSITKKIMIDHGGRINVSANPEGGATFSLLFRESQPKD